MTVAGNQGNQELSLLPTPAIGPHQAAPLTAQYPASVTSELEELH